MTQASVPPPPTERPDPDALQIVVFGMPDAGKSSLLGALAQAASTQGRLLEGELAAAGKGLEELRRRVYENQPRETLEEIVPYAAKFEPFDGSDLAGQQIPVTLYDCDGRVANEILSRKRALATSNTGLGRAVLKADALLLVVDAAAAVEQVESDFREFARFVRQLEAHRGQRVEVGGLPVYLVLTKCDLLAKSNDNRADWVARVEQRKRQVAEHFREFLAQDEVDAPVPFGDIDLRVEATAVRWPKLEGEQERETTPYGVAELFRDSLAEASQYRGRSLESSRRLMWTSLGLTTVVGVMVALAVSLVTNRQTPTAEIPLAGKVRGLRTRDADSPAARLREPLPARIDELEKVRAEADFGRLGKEERDWVETRLAEAKDYTEYKTKLVEVRPADARSEEDLRKVEERLNGEMNLPDRADYRKNWPQTEAGLFREKLLADVQAVRQGVRLVEAWLRDLKREADALYHKEGELAAVPWPDWVQRVQQLSDRATKSRPFDEGATLKGSRSASGFSGREGLPLTYDAVRHYPAVHEAQSGWEASQPRLSRLRDLIVALGLSGSESPQTAPLKLPTYDRLTAATLSERVEAVRQNYPTHTGWTRDELPEVPRAAAAAVARSGYLSLVRAGQGEVLRHLQRVSPDGRETRERWLSVADWLGGSPELTDWKVMARMLLRLCDPQAEEPTADLARFLREPGFRLELRNLQMELPDELRGQRYAPAGPITVSLDREGTPRTSLVFTAQNTPRPDPARQLTRYSFLPTGDPNITFRPGDAVWAELRLRERDGGDKQLTWVLARSTTYRFECLTRSEFDWVPRAPRIHEVGRYSQVEDPVAEGVTINVLPAGGLPRVPDLLPVVKLEKSP